MQKHSYIVEIQYLGFRFHGWQKQPNEKTVESMVEKSLFYTLETDEFKILGCSRTDSKVSANQYLFELFIKEGLGENFLDLFNLNLPPDIRALSVRKSCKGFSILNSPRTKEYLYLFSHGTKAHPFCAPLMYVTSSELNIDLMKKGAKLFEGEHTFTKYCTKPKDRTNLTREIIKCRIEENGLFKANFFPETSYMLRIVSRGFLRYQVRLIMGQLLKLGAGEISVSDISESLNPKDTNPLRYIAPASGLILNKIETDSG